jgi:hypothetical protein
MSWIFNANTGQPLTIAAQNMLYNLGTPDIVGPFDTKAGKVEYGQGQTWNYLGAGTFEPVEDPQCAQVTTAQGLRGQCTIDALADAGTGQIVLQNPLPGTRGTLGQRVIEGPGQWRFDANIQKSFQLTESKTLQFRMDARNILNHPEPNAPALSIVAPNFGTINGKSALRRQFQAQLRLTF